MRRDVDNLVLSRQLLKRTVALVLAGGRGSRLQQLTDRRAKPAVYFGGKFRIVDFVLSNCLNSGIRRIAVVTQYKSHSLLRHLQRGGSFLRGCRFGPTKGWWPLPSRSRIRRSTKPWPRASAASLPCSWCSII